MSFDTNFSQVRSAQNVSGSAFEGSTILFDWVTPNQKFADLDECYQYHKIRITQYDAAGNPGPLRPALHANGQLYIPYLNPNYIHLMTQSLYLTLQGRGCDEIIDPAISTTLFEQCFSSEEDRKTKDGLMLNHQVRNSQTASINNVILSNTVPLDANTIAITANSTNASYSFSKTVNGYTFSGTITASFAASGVNPTNYPFIITVTDSVGNTYFYQHPALAVANVVITPDTSVAFAANANILTSDK